MRFLRRRFEISPEYARIVPFAVFVLLTYGQGRLGPISVYWVYLIKTVVGGWLLWESRPFVPEMRWVLSWQAVLVGIGIAAIWVGLDGWYPRLAKPEVTWNPEQRFGNLGWFWNIVRLLGSSLIVPPLEEVFYRSFLYRYLVRLNFLSIPLSQFHGRSFLITSAIFGLMHPDRWVAGIICGLAFQGLTVRKGRLGEAMTAHGITNFLLGLWVISKRDWSFW